MKNVLKSVVAFLLALVARAVVHRYRPHIVMVTGSVGKTSTKDAVAAVLRSRFLVRASEKSFNSEFGVPFTILGVKNPFDDALEWLTLLKSAFALLVLPNHYPNMLVLEVGADRPGDMAKIARIAAPEAVVVTCLPEIPVHVEAYASPAAVREEEFSPAYALPSSAPLIVSADDQYALDMAMRMPARVISYGTASGASVYVSDIGFYEEQGAVAGMRAKASMQGKDGELVIRGSVGDVQICPAAAALAVAHAYSIALPEALKALEGYEPPPGRGRLLRGKNGSVIIDDSYNASPAAVEEALTTLKKVPKAARRVAVLGDMLELGRYSVMEHERIGTLARTSAGLVVTVGIRARSFASASGDAEVVSFDNSYAAAQALPGLVRQGDVVLIKGSQSIRMERVVEALLADPSDTVRLVRQDKAWKRRV